MKAYRGAEVELYAFLTEMEKGDEFNPPAAQTLSSFEIVIFGAVCNERLQTINFVMSLRIPYDTTRESLNGFL
jgi:hypothetical protein